MIDPLEPHPVDERAVSHRGLDCDPEYFLCDYHERITSDFAAQSARLARESGREIGDLAGWKRAFADDLARAAPFAPGIKCTLAYERRLDFAPVSEAEAAPIAARALRGETLPPADAGALQNHLIDVIAGLAADHGLPMKFHTGLHAGGWNLLENADPKPLTTLIRRHPRTRFDLFHISYPYYREAAVLAKYYPNVTVDLCWAWAFSPYETAQALHALLDLVPTGKVFGFGGDYYHLEGVVGHALLAREGIARVLAERVRHRRHSQEDAMEIARIILHDGPAQHFGVERKRAAIRAARAARAAKR
jgi:predicted TIM-barrel fold metal-dependent hydrolase